MVVPLSLPDLGEVCGGCKLPPPPFRRKILSIIFGHFSAASPPTTTHTHIFPDRMAVMRGYTPFQKILDPPMRRHSRAGSRNIFRWGRGSELPTPLKSNKQNKPQEGAVFGCSIGIFLCGCFVRPIVFLNFTVESVHSLVQHCLRGFWVPRRKIWAKTVHIRANTCIDHLTVENCRHEEEITIKSNTLFANSRPPRPYGTPNWHKPYSLESSSIN